MKYSYSLDRESYTGEYDTIEEAIQAGLAEARQNSEEVFWVGGDFAPTQPEEFWEAEDWLEHVSCQDDYAGDWAEDWDASTRAQREELEAEVRKVMAAWLDRHGLRPAFWNVENAEKFCVADFDAKAEGDK